MNLQAEPSGVGEQNNDEHVSWELQGRNILLALFFSRIPISQTHHNFAVAIPRGHIGLISQKLNIKWCP